MDQIQMTYKGYKASATYKEEDTCFAGKIDNITDLVSFEGVKDEIEDAFHDAVEDYIETCKELHKAPAFKHFNL